MSHDLVPIDSIFNVYQQRENFVSYMGNLRSAVWDQDRDPVMGLRITRPTTTVPRQWLHLRMEVEHRNPAIILWVRTDNLYVQGFERVVAGQERPGPRWEFGRTGKEEKDKGKNKRAKKKKEKEGQSQQHLIPGSQFLGFGGSYTELGGLAPEVRIGRYELENAILGLAEYQGTRPGDHPPVETWLRTIVITISESMRLTEVCKHVGNLLRGNCDGRLDDRGNRKCLLINGWGKMCKAVIDCANNPQGDDTERYKYMTDFCKSTQDALKAVAILNHGASDDKKGKTKRPKRQAWGRAVDDVPEGLTFVEIFSVAVDRRSNLYGHIAIDDGLSSEVLFRRGRSSAQLVGPGGLVELTGPSRALWGDGEVIMHVDLMSLSNVPDMTPDMEVGSGQLVWNTYDTRDVVYDKVEEYVFEGLSGAVNVRGALITNAAVATVVVEHTGGRGEKYLYGMISAATAMFGPVDKITLFNRERKHAVSVQAGRGIPLLRDVAIVPLDSPLTISFDLWARASVPDMTPDDRIVKGDAKIDIGMDHEKVIGEVTVQVTWSFN